MSMRSKGIVGFVVLAYAISWILWEISIRLLGGIPRGLTLQPIYLAAGFGPAIAAIVVRRWITREGFADAGLRLNLRRSWRYYLAGWLLPLPVLTMIILLATALGVGRPDFAPLAILPLWLAYAFFLRRSSGARNSVGAATCRSGSSPSAPHWPPWPPA